MSRSGYSNDCDNLQLWRGAVDQAIRGKRGQKLLRDMLAALDAMPVKRLIAGELITCDGECCALGAVAMARDLDVTDLDESDRDQVGKAFNIAPALAAEIAYVNDEEDGYPRRSADETPEQRFERMRKWVAGQIVSGGGG